MQRNLSFLRIVLVFVMVIGIISGFSRTHEAWANVIFEDAFSEYEIGVVPPTWVIRPAQVSKYSRLSEVANVKVIDDPTTPSGRTLVVQVYDNDTFELPVISPTWSAGKDAKVVSFEYQFRSIAGGTAHSYIRINGRPAISYPLPSRSRLREGWNRIRFVANLEHDEVYVYLNDEEHPISGPRPFREKPDSWGLDTEFRFLIPPGAEFHFTDFKATIIEKSEDLRLFEVRENGNFQAVKEVLSGERDEAFADWWGFDPEDATEILQAAIDSGVPRLIVPNVGRDWIVRPMTLRSDLELIFEEGTVVAAKKDEFHGRSDSLFTASNVDNVKIVGYGATWKMQKDDYTDPNKYEKAEWRMGLSIRGSRNVELLGLTIRDTGGDGIYLGRGSNGRTNENIIIRDVVLDNNYRQGISVITAKNLLIENSVFKNTAGTPPMAGIDFEPNGPDEVLQDIVVRNSVFDHNESYGITINVQSMDREARLSILMENILVRGGQYGVVIRSFGAPGEQPSGEIVLRNCIIESTRHNAIRIPNREHVKGSDPFQVRFENCIIHDAVSNPLLYRSISDGYLPIVFDGGNWLGRVHFEDVTVVDTRDRPVLYGGVRENAGDDVAVQRDDISGEISVVNSYGARAAWHAAVPEVDLTVVPKESVTIDYDQVISLPDYIDPPIEATVTPAVKISNVNTTLFPPTHVRCVFVPQLELLHLNESDIKDVEILLNGTAVYQGHYLPSSEELRICTGDLSFGRHELTAIVRLHESEDLPKELRAEHHILVHNFRHGGETLFADDFSGYKVGSIPETWEINPPSVSGYKLEDIADVQIIDDPTSLSGRALKVEVFDAGRFELPVMSSTWTASDSTRVMAFEYQFRSISGGPALSYIRVNRQPSISLAVPSQTRLLDGWNRMRIVADANKDEVYVYLNDMEQPISGPSPFRVKPDSWASEAQFRFLIPSNTEIHFTDFHAWVIE